MQDQLIRQGINKESLDSGQQALLTVGKKIVDGRPLLPRVSSSSRSISSTSSLDSGPDTPPPWPPRGPTGPRGPRGPQDDHGLNGPVLGSSGGPAQVPIVCLLGFHPLRSPTNLLVIWAIHGSNITFPTSSESRTLQIAN
ncbi:hypothetical protein BFJ68_g6876 [Fusarium oxysporum]|uniref:Uncharacterized protein n=1 Tax=Fusarium oxysporum TaxID=5507 RepID=A0A420R9G5_FUSOX|nr:hypothetical protein BFJ68_g6876 [Fusarium oxysporum]